MQMSVLMLGRFLQGVGVCSLNVSTLSIINDRYEGSHRIHLLALINFGSTLSPMLGPVLGGYLFITLGWRANFLIVFMIALLAVGGLWQSLPKHKPTLVPMSFKEVILVYVGLSKNVEFMANLLLYAALTSGVIAYLTGSAFVMIKQLQLAPELYGLLQLWIFGAGALGSLSVIAFIHYVNVKKIVAVGLSLVVVATLLLTFNSLLWSDSVRALIIPMMVYMLGLNLC